MLPPPVTSTCSAGGISSASSLFAPKACCPKRGEESPCTRRQSREQREGHPRRLGSLALPSLVAAVLALSPPYLVPTPASLALTVDAPQRGGALFHKACIGCHDAGGNILQPGATLFMRDLERNGVATEEEIYKITYFGKGRMPGFGEKCTPRGQCTFGPRLQDEEIKQLAEFVRLQADGGWPKLEVLRE